MAGSYPDNPSRRMGWDDDGTILLVSPLIGTTPPPWPSIDYYATAADRTDCNDEDNVRWEIRFNSNANQAVGLIFPELREVDGLICVWSNAGNGAVYYSSDTTNMLDGTWAQLVADLPDFTLATTANYRTQITSTAQSNVRALEGKNTGSGGKGNVAFHVYGEITPGQTPDRLLFFENVSGLEFGLPVDYGDVPRGSASDFVMKLRNNSGSLTASTIQLTAEALYLNSGAWYTFNEGTGFQSTLPLASSIGPGADSPAITVRRVIPDSEALGLHAGRVKATVGSWA